MFVTIRISQVDLDNFLAKLLDTGNWESFDKVSAGFDNENLCEYLTLLVEFRNWSSVCKFYYLQKTEFEYKLNTMNELTKFLLNGK